MKTSILILLFLSFFTFISIAQRNPAEDRQNVGDRIDRIKDENPERNPNQGRQPIQSPEREKDNPIKPPVPNEPVIVEIWNPVPRIPYHPPECPPQYPYPPIIIDNPPSLDELPLSEVYDTGTKNLDLELYNEAIKCFNILLKNDPLDYEVYTLRGRAYHGLELYDKAKKDYQKSIKINKSYADGYYYLGLTEINLGNIDEAIVDFELAADFGNGKAKSLLKKYFRD